MRAYLRIFRNYHVFYYLLEGATDEERKKHFLLQPKDYYYLNQVGIACLVAIYEHLVQNSFFACESMNERYEYERLRHSMDAVGFSSTAQQKIFGMISAVLLLGNIGFIKVVLCRKQRRSLSPPTRITRG